METLPIGLISMNETGIIFAVDAWAERILGYETGALTNKHIGTVFSDNGQTFIDIVRTKGPGYIGRKRVKTRTGTEIQVEVAMAVGVEKHLQTLQIVFTLLD